MKILISGDGAMGQSVFETAKQMQIEVIGQVGQNLSGSLNSAFCVSDLPSVSYGYNKFEPKNAKKHTRTCFARRGLSK